MLRGILYFKTDGSILDQDGGQLSSVTESCSLLQIRRTRRLGSCYGLENALTQNFRKAVRLQSGWQTWAVLSSKNGLNLVLAGQQFVLQERGKRGTIQEAGHCPRTVFTYWLVVIMSHDSLICILAIYCLDVEPRMYDFADAGALPEREVLD